MKTYKKEIKLEGNDGLIYNFFISLVLNYEQERRPNGKTWFKMSISHLGSANFVKEHKVEQTEKNIEETFERVVRDAENWLNQRPYNRPKEESCILKLGFTQN